MKDAALVSVSIVAAVATDYRSAQKMKKKRGRKLI